MDMFNNSLDSDQNESDWDPTQDLFQYDDRGDVLRIEHADGSVTVSLDGKSLVNQDKNKSDKKWFSNLAEDLSETILSGICETLLQRIEEDIEARQQKIGIETSEIMNLLGFTRKSGKSSGLSGAMESLSNSDIRHPLLLQAAVDFQANMHSELLPSDGPLKIHDYTPTRMGELPDEHNTTDDLDALADDFEILMNHYLLEGAPEYYPEMDRMFFMGGLTGDGFQKTFNCPMRNRPAIETIDYDHLIVDVGATHLRNAKRITQIEEISENEIKRMQILGIYRDVSLSRMTDKASMTPFDNAKDIFQGVNSASYSPDDDDVNREIYECRCELNIEGYEHKFKGKISGLKVPYTVTIDKTSREILSIIRNYEKDDIKAEAIPCFVQFPFIPGGFGFYCIGLAKLLMNATTALTRGWQICLDNGNLHNFPGFVYDSSVYKGDSNILSVPAGGGAPLAVPMGKSIQDVVHYLPYQDLSPNFLAFLQSINESFQSVTNSTNALVAEGRTDAPVGTTIALIEQAQKALSAVHKRYLRAQGETFKILVDCFKRDPDAFFRFDKSATRNWDMKLFMSALDRFNLVPKADPNTASHIQRMAKEELKVSLMDKYPDSFNKYETLLSALRAAKISSPEQFLIQPSPNAGMPSPQEQAQQQMVQAKMKDADARMATAQAKMEENKVNMIDSQADAQNRTADREARDKENRMKLMTEIAIHEHQTQHEKSLAMHAALTSPSPSKPTT